MINKCMFSAFRYVLVLYAICFTFLFVSTVPSLFGFTVTVQETDYHQLHRGDIVVFRDESSSSKNELVLAHNQELDVLAHNQELDVLVTAQRDSLPASFKVIGSYAYHLPYIGVIIEFMKDFTTLLVMGSILLLLFSYTLQPKRRIWRKRK
ncbi:hypothetical protein [Priestia megaterium]|uniref:hypothetical protein n=1 Tax=Priestia megaterium TaxID=1404 RepID=UPI0035B574EA